MHISTIIMMIIGVIIIGVDSQCEHETGTLCVDKISFKGFNQLQNRYAFAMQEFKGSIYVGTLNAINAPDGIVAFFFGEEFATNGAQIYKATPNDINDNENMNDTSIWNWRIVAWDGLYDKWNYGVRKFAVVNDFLYAVTGNHVNGFEVWKTENGENWEVVMDNGGNGDVDNTSGRGMGYHDGFLYIGAENRVSGAKMFRREVTENGDLAPGSNWEEVISDGLGDTENIWFSDFMEYNGYLYTGTLNTDGMEIWRTLNGGDPQSYERVFKSNPLNQAAMKLYVYNERLYIGTMNLAGAILEDPLIAGAMLWVNNDDDGRSFVQLFDGGGPKGCTNIYNGYMWYIQEFNNRLYVGTFDMNGFLDGESLATGFDLFSSDDPMDQTKWVRETTNAFDNAGHYGLRSMAVIGDKLIMGTATANDEVGGCLVFQATFKEQTEPPLCSDNHKIYDGRYNGTFDFRSV